MTVLVEKNLKIEIPDGAKARKFDDNNSHGLSHCMKVVDFIVEWNDMDYFIEIKDPEHPEAKAEFRTKFIGKFLGGKIDEDLKVKFRDSFLEEWSCKRACNPICYLVLIAVRTIGAPTFLTRTDALKRKLPVLGPHGNLWPRPFVINCLVMNLATWNQSFPHFPVSRITD